MFGYDDPIRELALYVMVSDTPYAAIAITDDRPTAEVQQLYLEFEPDTRALASVA